MGTTRSTGWPTRIAVALLVLGAATAVGTTSVWTVGRDEQGVVLRFGKVARIVPAGIHLTLPWPAETLVRVSTSEVRQVSVGFKLMDQLIGIAPADDEVQWLTGDTNIVELRAIVSYTRADPVKYLFGSSLPEADPTLDAAAGGQMLQQSERRQLVVRKAAEAVLSERIGSMTVDDVLSTGKAVLQREARDRVQQLLDQLGLGLAISAVDVIEVGPPRDVMSAFNAVTSAKANRERRITEAEGDRSRRLPGIRAAADRTLRAAETYRSETENRAHGEADRFATIQAEIAKNPDLGTQRLWLEAMRKILSWVDLKVVSGSTARPVKVYLDG